MNKIDNECTKRHYTKNITTKSKGVCPHRIHDERLWALINWELEGKRGGRPLELWMKENKKNMKRRGLKEEDILNKDVEGK